MTILSLLLVLGLIVIYYEIKNAPTIDDDEFGN